MESEAQATPQLDRRPLYDGILRQGSDNPPPAAEIARQLEPQIAEHLELAAWWPEHELREGWKLGDYSLYAIGFRAAAFKGLYVRFISEPHREALLEVSSSQEDPALKDAAPEHMKEALRGLGFHPGGDGAGFEKPVRVESPDDCRLLAQEMAGLITGCLGYDTTKPITFKRELKEHTQTARVFHFVGMGDIARLLRSSGLVIWQIDGKPDIGYRTVDRPRFEVRPFAEVSKGAGWFRAIQFAFFVKLDPELAEEIVREVGRKFTFGAFTVRNDVLTITHSVCIEGGVTEANLRFHLLLWRRLLDRVVESYYRHVEEDDDD